MSLGNYFNFIEKITLLINFQQKKTDVKKYSVIKWLENKQFDRNNEFTGRITSVLHSNILDIDAEYLTVNS
jgi:hypothetical protein